MEQTASRDFSQLPQDILALIANLLSPISDFLSFGAVCRSWRSAAGKQNYPPSRQMPWLMLAQDDPSITTRRFFNTSDNTIHELELPEACSTKLVGSTDGWLVIVTEDLQVRMLNPMSRNVVSLPPLSGLQAFHGHEVQRVWTTPRMKRDWLLKKVCLSPGAPRDCMAMALYGHCKLTFALPGDESWTKITTKKLWPFSDLIYFKGAFYAVNHKGSVVACEVRNRLVVVRRVAPRISKIYGACATYLVESLGDLLQVVRIVEPTSDKTIRFEVFRWESSGEEWEEVASLGDRVVFVGCNSSISLCALHISECKPNCIYFTDVPNCIYYTDDNAEMYRFHNGGGADMGVYNLEDGNIVKHYTGDSRSLVSPPLWVQPTLWKRD